MGGSFCCKTQKEAICCSIENRNPVILDWSWKEAIDPLVRLCVQSCSVNSQLCVNEDGWCGHLSLKSRPGLILIPPSSPDYKVHRFGILKNKCFIDKIFNTSYLQWDAKLKTGWSEKLKYRFSLVRYDHRVAVGSEYKKHIKDPIVGVSLPGRLPHKHDNW